jgi:hypothetical protein
MPELWNLNILQNEVLTNILYVLVMERQGFRAGGCGAPGTLIVLIAGGRFLLLVMPVST